MTNELERIAAALEATGDYRVLRRVTRRTRIHDDDGSVKKIGVILDVETTGLDPVRDEVIELGMTRFEFDAAGRVFTHPRRIPRISSAVRSHSA